MRPSVSVVVLGLLVSQSEAWARRVEPSGVSASSTYEGEGNYDASRSMDGRQSTSWVEGDSGSGLGAHLDFDFAEEIELARVRVWAGDWFSSESWDRANRPREIELRFSDGSTERFTLDDEMRSQEFTLPSPKRTSAVQIRLKSIHNGSTWPDTPISEVQFFDTQAPRTAEVARMAASSVHAADADGNYEPVAVSDGILDSMWCEGSSGDGSGEWLEFTFAAPTAVSHLDLVNGIGTSLPFWMKGNRASAARLTFSDGSSVDVAVQGTIRPQTIDFAEHRTTSVKVTFTGVTAGKEFNDLCISEAYFR